jgi:hypothetical protein
MALGLYLWSPSSTEWAVAKANPSAPEPARIPMPAVAPPAEAASQVQLPPQRIQPAVPPASEPKAAAPVVPDRPTPPILLSAEHAKVLLPPPNVGRPLSLAELHMQLSSESKDANWAPDLEQSIRQALTVGNASAEFEILSVECRATLCEVLAFGNLPSSGQRWNQVWDDIQTQSWYAGFRGNTTSSFVQNGRYTIVTILQRVKRS